MQQSDKNMNSDQSKMIMKRSLSYNDLKKKRMLRSDRSRSKLTQKNSQLMISKQKTKNSNIQTQKQFIRKLPANKKQLKKLLTEIKGIVKYLQAPQICDELQAKQQQQQNLHQLAQCNVNRQNIQQKSNLGHKNIQKDCSKIITRKRSLNILCRPIYNLQKTQKLILNDRNKRCDNNKNEFNYKSNRLRRINQSARGIEIKQQKKGSSNLNISEKCGKKDSCEYSDSQQKQFTHIVAIHNTETGACSTQSTDSQQNLNVNINLNPYSHPHPHSHSPSQMSVDIGCDISSIHTLQDRHYYKQYQDQKYDNSAINILKLISQTHKTPISNNENQSSLTASNITNNNNKNNSIRQFEKITKSQIPSDFFK